MIHLACSGESLEGIIESQYQLAKHSNIDIRSSNNMPDFERVMIYGMLIRDAKKERDAIKDASTT